MAEIRKVVPSAGVSNFQQVAADGGGAFRVLADGMNQAYDMLKPLAIKQRIEHNADIERQIARQQIGDPASGLSTGGSSSGGGAGVPKNAGWVVNGLVARGMAPHHAEGFAINFKDESNFNTAAVGDGGNAYGLAQWNGPRKRGLEAFATSQGKPASDGDVQLDFLMQELRSNEAGAWSKIQSTGDRGSAAAAVLNHFERPAEQHRARREAAYLGGNVSVSTSGAADAPYQAPTMIREADGKLTARLYSPMGGEVVQASNAAAGVAYQSEMMLKGMGDLMGISEQFPLDAQGYQQAAQGYVDQIVDKAPDMFKADLRTSLEREAKQRTLGMMEEQHRDIRQRANNSSSALVDRWSDNLSSAIAGGNPDEIAAAQGELDGVLAAREALPGVSWTPEQSDNVRIKAADAAQTAIKARETEQKATYKTSLDTIAKAANAGLHGADESILNNPEVAALLPEEYLKARGAILRRETMPGFTAATGPDRKAALAEIVAMPVNTAEDVATIEAFREADKAATKAFDEDPIAAATTYLPQKPKPLPTPDPTNPQAFINSMSERGVYARKLVEGGYADKLSLLSADEAKTFGAMLGKDVPAEARMAMAGAVVGALGDDAATFFRQAGNTDPVLEHSGVLMASGAPEQTSFEALKGQEMLATKQANKPTSAGRIEDIDPAMAQAIAMLPGDPVKIADTIMQTAIAIAAYRSPNTADPSSEEAKTVMQGALQSAFGQSTNLRGELIGGVQPIGGRYGILGGVVTGNPTVLPPNMSGERLNTAMEAAFAPLIGYSGPVQPDLWIAAGAVSAPMKGGVPLPNELLSDGRITLSLEGGTTYSMQYMSPGGPVDITDAKGGLFVFDAEKLITASREPKPKSSSLIPTNVKVFTEAMGGRTAPITQSDFTKDEVAVIERLAAFAGPDGKITYDTYAKAFPEGDPLLATQTVNALSVIDGKRDSSAVDIVRTTLGQFSVSEEGDNYVINDKYNFNTQYPTREGSREAFWNKLKVKLGIGGKGFSETPYELARLAGEAFGPRGASLTGVPNPTGDSEGIPVNLKVRKQTKAQRGTK